MNVTPIEWTDFSANPLKYRDAAGNVVWACVHESQGCKACYAEVLAKRYGRGGPFNVQTTNGVTPFLDENELRKMRTAKVIGGIPVSGSKCFLGDMTDIFGPWVSDELLNHLFSNTLEVRTDVTWQLLTKRAQRMHEYLSWRWGGGRIPSRHIHIGVSVENQQFADARIPLLLQTPAAVRFISAEPLLGPIDLAGLRGGTFDAMTGCGDRERLTEWEDTPSLDWVIVGGESGNGARPCHTDWIADIVLQCARAGVPCFVKQLGSNGYQRPGGYPLRDRKGGDITEWPADLRVRQFPHPNGTSGGALAGSGESTT